VVASDDGLRELGHQRDGRPRAGLASAAEGSGRVELPRDAEVLEHRGRAVDPRRGKASRLPRRAGKRADASAPRGTVPFVPGVGAPLPIRTVLPDCSSRDLRSSN
jgi:hypothetical protein